MTRSVDLLPVAFPSLRHLLCAVSRDCGRESSLLTPSPTAKRQLAVGDRVQMALLAPGLRLPVDVQALVVAKVYKPALSLKLQYTLRDVAQMELALAHFYKAHAPSLPVSLQALTGEGRHCQLSALSSSGATFDFSGSLESDRCVPESKVQLQLPHQSGRLDVEGEVSWVARRLDRSRLQVRFPSMGGWTRQKVEDIVLRFRLGPAPWTPRLMSPGL